MNVQSVRINGLIGLTAKKVQNLKGVPNARDLIGKKGTYLASLDVV
jgi:hypothetical protein